MSERMNRTLLDMVRSMMNLTTLPLYFWDYALETTALILNMVLTKKVDKTPYESWYEKVPDLFLLKEMMDYYFYFPPENKIVVARDNQVWCLVDLLPNDKTVGSKWLFKKKTDMGDNVHTYKARLVAKDFTQTYGVDYEETFSPVADIRAIRILIAIATIRLRFAWRRKSSKQSTTAMSATEAEYIAAMAAVWISKFISWLAIERLKQGESINVQDLETNLYWEFGKSTSRDGESLELYYSQFYKMMNELVRNQCHVTNHQVNVQFLLQLQPEWQRFVTLVKQSQELKTVSYHKLYDILKQHQNEVNEIRAERLARTANPLALVGTGYDNQRAVNIARARENIGTPVVQKSGIQCYNCKECGHVSRECQKPKRVKDAAYHKEKMLLCKQEEELGSTLIYTWHTINKVTPDSVDNSRPIFDDEPMHKVQNNNDNYNVFAMENKHPEQPESSNDIYLTEQGETNITIDSSDICYDRAQDDQDKTNDLDQERDLLASLILESKCGN
ncbi:retrovirus-related pol polyprotein from transposon TNT 1-94 [Tanacetum coccineum]